ncbi:MAG: winged helix DNA-binding protein [Bacteroidota bacterium]|nr:winged helix DNA-binding protein [Bacteroidota bacterium]
MKPELTFDFQIRKTWIQVAKMYNELVAQKGITTSIGMALLNIDINDGIRSTALGPKMGLESTSLSRVLKSMKNQGLIVKESDPEDKRSVLIKLTDAGLKKRNMARHIVLEFNQLIADKIGEKRSAEFLKTIADINIIVDNIKSS